MSTALERKREEAERRARRKAALEKPPESVLGLTPEALEAAKALEGRKGEKRRRLWWDLPSHATYPVVPPPLQVQQDRDRQIALALEVSKKRAKILESLSKVQSENNAFKRAELARDILDDLWSANATVIAAGTGAKADVARAELEQLGALDKERRTVLERQSMTKAAPGAQASLKLWEQSFIDITGNPDAYEEEGMEGSLQDDYVYQLAAATEDAFLNQSTEDQRRMLAHMNGKLADSGLMTVSEHIMGWRTQEPELLQGEQSALLIATKGFDTASLIDTQRMADINERSVILRGDIADKVAELDPEAAGRLRQFETAFEMVSKAIHPEGEEDPFKSYKSGLTDLDQLLEDLERPTYTDEWHRALDQLKQHPMFKDYMDLRGFTGGQEADAALQLIKEAKPFIARVHAAQRMTGEMGTEGPIGAEKIPFLGRFLKPTRTQAEARRVALEGGKTTEERAEGEDPSLRTQIEKARTEEGLHPSQTIFQQIGVEPATRPGATETEFGKERGGGRTQLSPAPGTRRDEGVPSEEGRPSTPVALASMSAPTLVGGAQLPIDAAQEEEYESGLRSGSAKRQQRLEAIRKFSVA